MDKKSCRKHLKKKIQSPLGVSFIRDVALAFPAYGQKNKKKLERRGVPTFLTAPCGISRRHFSGALELRATGHKYHLKLHKPLPISAATQVSFARLMAASRLLRVSRQLWQTAANDRPALLFTQEGGDRLLWPPGR